MSISLRNVISILCPDHKFENNTSTQSENIVPYHTSKYTETSQYRQVIQCIYRSLYDEFLKQETVDNEINYINEFIRTHKFIELINMRKVATAINQETINNDIILFLAAYYECNIYVYYENCKLLKSFYMEENIEENKTAVLLFYNPTDEHKYQILNESIELNHSDIIKRFPETLLIPIGLELNKYIIIGENETINYYEECDENITVLNYLNEINFTNNELPLLTMEQSKKFLDFKAIDLIIHLRNICSQYKNATFTLKT